jgi:hypothetical protein
VVGVEEIGQSGDPGMDSPDRPAQVSIRLAVVEAFA